MHKDENGSKLCSWSKEIELNTKDNSNIVVNLNVVNVINPESSVDGC